MTWLTPSRPSPKARNRRSARTLRARLAATVGQWVLSALLVVLLLLAAGQGSPALAQKRSSSDKANIEMNFKNVDIVNFLTIMSQALDIPLVWDETKVRGAITLVSPTKFNRKDALNIFETVLNMHGYTTIRSPDSPIVQVVPAQDAPRLPSPTRGAAGGKDHDYFITQIIPLKYADANQVRAAITPLISKSAGLAIYAPGNVLVLSDTEPNVRRIQEIIKEMDVPPGDVDFAVIPLKYASANKMVPLLTTLSAALPGEPGIPAPRGRRAVAPQAGGTELKAVADDRTNTLILVGDPLVLEKFRNIISTLDVPGAVEERGVKVFHLQYADATDLVKILKDVNLRESTQPGQPPQAQAAAASQLSRLTITADKATNTLIVFGPSELIATMGDMVKALDVRRPQVYVEVLIMEMTFGKSLDLGVRWQATGTVKNGAVGIGTPDATPNTLENALAAGQGSAVGIVGNEITFAGQKFTSFSGFIKATQQDQDLNVLANPQLLTLNNQEAEINVSQVVPVSTRTVTNQTLQTTTEYEFKDVGIILKITPQITGNDKVRLAIDQESSSIAAQQDVQNVSQQAITTLKRKLNTQVVVDNNTTMAIGGLIQDQTVESATKVPCLGDIPVLGWLFRSTNDTVRKTNLIIFIRPHIILTPEDLEAQTVRAQQRYDTVRAPKVDAESLLRKDFELPQKPSAKPQTEPAPKQ
ncbi:MAG TPA: type II secretion system secretin GspD [bacterium]|nr:type II secretion system secretin GspD [bacterium]